MTPLGYPDLQEGGLEYQPDVYRLAQLIAQATKADTLIDVGCGRGRKLESLAPRLRIIGLDQGTNIAFCRDQLSFGQWIERDFERSPRLPLGDLPLSSSVVVCADVVEQLVAPEGLMADLAVAARSTRPVLTSTPDTARIEHQRPMRPPANPSHVREWARSELLELLLWSGFRADWLGHTRERTLTLSFDTLLFVHVGART